MGALVGPPAGARKAARARRSAIVRPTGRTQQRGQALPGFDDDGRVLTRAWNRQLAPALDCGVCVPRRLRVHPRANSAFAGLYHYLARGLEETHGRVTLMWPGGNGELVAKMAEMAEMAEVAEVAPRRRTGMMVFDIDHIAGLAHAWDVPKQQVVEIAAQKLLWAAPRFGMRHAVAGDPLEKDALTYAPWLVANVELKKRPGGIGIPRAWDNVDMEASHLRYVVSTHGESLVDAKTRKGTVITYHDAKVETAGRSPAKTRIGLLELGWRRWPVSCWRR